MIGVFFELFWLDTFPAGTYIPPQQTFAAFFTILTADYLGLSQPGAIFLLLLAVLPLTSLMHRLEVWFRTKEDSNYKRVIRQVQKEIPDYEPRGIVLGSVLKAAGMNMAVFALCLGTTLAGLELIPLSGFAALPELTWFHLLSGGLAAGFLALRSKRVYGLLICAAAAVAAALFFIH
ncbi:MAG: hypothetical protein K9K64_08090 [Desulfohalobiaceae bacterium]|nr:hypothetical protein [Desulfohalobiaceae bacterium]